MLLNRLMPVFCLCFLECLICQRSKAQATLSPLGHAPGYTNFVPTHISADGTRILGYANHAGTQETESLIWSLYSGWTELGSLPNEVNWRHSDPSGFSSDGRKATGNSYSHSYTGFEWAERSGMIALGSPAGTSESASHGMSGDGNTIIGTVLDPVSSVFIPFRWTPSHQFTLMTVLRNYFSGIPEATSFDSAITVGTCYNGANRRQEAVYWTGNGDVIGLGCLPGGALFSEAHSVSADGSVIVGESESTMASEAFRWTAATGMVGLGNLNALHGISTANFVSPDGQKILGITDTSVRREPFVWVQVHGMRTLRDFLVQDYNMGSAVAGWRLDSAVAISADNRAMIGTGIDPSGNTQGWVIRFAPPPFILSGRITLQSSVDQAQSLSFLLTPRDGTASFTLSATLNPDRTFVLSGLPAKEYDLLIKGHKWLAKKIYVEMRGGDVTNINVTLRSGDANDDNAVDISDLLILIAHYNQQRSNAGYLDAADFDCDDACDIADLLLLISNYNKMGDH